MRSHGEGKRSGRLWFVPAAAVLMAVGRVQAGQAESDTEEARTLLLVGRVNTHYALLQERDCERGYDMTASAWRKEWERKEEVKYCRRMARAIRIIDWRIKSIALAGNRAKIRVILQARVKEGWFGWEEGTEEQTEFWSFENGSWYYIPIQLSDWDDSKSTEVPVPMSGQRPMKIKVQTKD